MAQALARPEDILVAYDPVTVSVGNQADPLEVHGGRRAFREMTGGADTYHEDFTSGLRDFVAARQAAGGFDDTTGGSTHVGGWFGGAGADPSALVVGLDWLAEYHGADNGAGYDTEKDGEDDDDDDGGLLSHVVSAGSTVKRSPEPGPLSAFIVPTGDADPPADGLEEALADSDDEEETAARSDNLRDVADFTRCHGLVSQVYKRSSLGEHMSFASGRGYEWFEFGVVPAYVHRSDLDVRFADSVFTRWELAPHRPAMTSSAAPVSPRLVTLNQHRVCVVHDGEHGAGEHVRSATAGLDHGISTAGTNAQKFGRSH